MISIERRLGILLAAFVISGAAWAQNVVRCGNAYGEQSCPGGQVVPAGDARTEAQRAQAARVIARDTRMAQALEAARLKAASAAQPASPPSSRKPGPKSGKHQDRAAKKRATDHFTAIAPAAENEAKRMRKVSGKASDRSGRAKERPSPKARVGSIPAQP